MKIIIWFFFVISIQAQHLDFYLGEKKLKSLSTGQMIALGNHKTLRLEHHQAKRKIKTYEVFALAPVVKSVFKKYLHGDEFSEVILEANDGYQSFTQLDRLIDPDVYLAYRDLDLNKGWEPVGRSEVSPAPYYMVWQNNTKTAANHYPWPWGLLKISLVKFSSRYPKVYPSGIIKNNDIYHGFEIFRDQCFRCHAIDKEGGKIGPDLAAPMNILEYRSEEFVKSYIENPNRYRYSKMPAHGHLKKSDLDAIIKYLKHIKDKSNKS